MTTEETKIYPIREVANIMGVQPHRIRFWERKGLLTGSVKTKGGQVRYTEADIELLKNSIESGEGSSKRGRKKGDSTVQRRSATSQVVTASSIANAVELESENDQVGQPKKRRGRTPRHATEAPVEAKIQVPTPEELLMSDVDDKTIENSIGAKALLSNVIGRLTAIQNGMVRVERSLASQQSVTSNPVMTVPVVVKNEDIKTIQDIFGKLREKFPQETKGMIDDQPETVITALKLVIEESTKIRESHQRVIDRCLVFGWKPENENLVAFIARTVSNS